MNFKFLLPIAFTAFSALPVAACDSDDNPDVVENGKVISEIDIDGNSTMPNNQEQQLKATLRYNDGSTKVLASSDGVVWNTSDASVLTVTQEGLARSVKAGTSKISVNYQGVKEEKDILVTP